MNILRASGFLLYQHELMSHVYLYHLPIRYLNQSLFGLVNCSLIISARFGLVDRLSIN